MELLHISAAALLLLKGNPRKISDHQAVEKLEKQIKEHGFQNPLNVYREEDGRFTILCGNHRFQAGKKLGMTEFPCVEYKGTREQALARAIADNKSSMWTEWDIPLLQDMLNELNTASFDMELTGFDADELDALLHETDTRKGLTDPDDVPETPTEPITRFGDVRQMGCHRLMCGDSTSIDAVEKLMGGERADMLLTDPPYNVAYEGGTKSKLTIKNDSMGDSQFRQFLRDAFTAADAVLKPGAVFYIWHADSEGYNFRGACKDSGWSVRQCLIWKKNSLVLGRQDYQWRHEPCLYGWKEGAAHLWASDRKQTTILDFDRPQRNAEHPTMKPVALFEYQMLNNTKGGDLVLDSFGGSGTTLIAAEKNGRVARLMELDPKYCDVIIKRWEDYTGKKAELTNGQDEVHKRTR